MIFIAPFSFEGLAQSSSCWMAGPEMAGCGCVNASARASDDPVEGWAESLDKGLRVDFHLGMRWIGLLLSLCWMVGHCGVRAESSTQVELWTDASAVRPGSVMTAAIRIRLADGWHIYWRNPGDEVGLKTRVEWALPPGITAGPIQWPAPEKPPKRISTL